MSIFKGKKVLVLGGMFSHCKVVKSIQSIGAIAYVADYLDFEDAPAKKIADKHFLISVKDVDALVQLCIDENIDGAIVTSLDAPQIPYQMLCERMGYHCFGTREQFEIFTNKNLFKERCIKYGLDVIPGYSVEEVENNLIDYPILIKPVDSRGSKGQTVCYTKEEAETGILFAKEESSNDEILIEKYMGGYSDLAIGYLVINGKALLHRISDRYLGSEENNLSRVDVFHHQPSKFHELYTKHTHEKVVAMLEGSGFKNAPILLQGFVDGDTVRFYDPGLRFGGSEYEGLFKYAVGVDIIEHLVKFSISGKIENMQLSDDWYKLENKRITHLLPAVREGIIAKIIGMDEIAKNSSVISSNVLYREGDYVPQTADTRRKVVEIYVLTDSLENEVETINFIYNTLHVLDDNGDEMICEIFDVDKLN